MSKLGEICSNKADAIPKWKFWRNWEREFWNGGLLADYAKATGNTELNDRAEAIHDKYIDRINSKAAKERFK